MTDKDKEAFEKWWNENGYHFEQNAYMFAEEAWKAACAYKDAESNKLIKFMYHALNEATLELDGSEYLDICYKAMDMAYNYLNGDVLIDVKDYKF